MLTYAAIYRERTGRLPVRCVLFFINEPERQQQLVSIPVDAEVVDAALDWTHLQVEYLQQTVLTFEQEPLKVEGGEFESRASPAGERMSSELKQQCTACGLRFDCTEYRNYLGPGKDGGEHPDVDRLNVKKN
ncbi:hypothetical protein [Archangium gephyra]|uniref:hypothetical protein n=1 Tax=Archangium gephyra TaxID=48 RepID=UPI0011C10636|nr:hypothetical protein [Archangium gephyra]